MCRTSGQPLARPFDFGNRTGSVQSDRLRRREWGESIVRIDGTSEAAPASAGDRRLVPPPSPWPGVMGGARNTMVSARTVNVTCWSAKGFDPLSVAPRTRPGPSRCAATVSSPGFRKRGIDPLAPEKANPSPGRRKLILPSRRREPLRVAGRRPWPEQPAEEADLPCLARLESPARAVPAPAGRNRGPLVALSKRSTRPCVAKGRRIDVTVPTTGLRPDIEGSRNPESMKAGG